MAELLNAVFAVLLCVLLNGVVGHSLSGRHPRESGSDTKESTTLDKLLVNGTTVKPDSGNSTVGNAPKMEPQTGLIVGVLLGVIAFIVAGVVIAALWIRNKRQRDSEYERAAKVQRSSANSAGVYVDLTSAGTPIVKKHDASNEITELDKLKRMDDEEI